MEPSARSSLVRKASDSFMCYYKKPISGDIPSVEDLLQVFTDEREREEQGKWGQAAALLIMREGLKMKVKDISTSTGLSPAMIREMIKTFSAFPKQEQRVADLSFYHHRLAAGTTQPHKWLNKAVINGWSTRQLAEHIKLSGMTSKEAKDRAKLAKAERVVREIKEILKQGGEARNYIVEQLIALSQSQSVA